MTFEDFEIIKNACLDDYIDQCPIKLALKGVDKAICTQVKYLQKAKDKLPDYYSARCVIPELSFEQSSSLYTSKAKDYSGKLCIDLTCGIGSDTLHFSKNFERVVTIERDELLSKIAIHNFEKLKVENVEVVCADSCDFIQKYEGEKADLIFIDPARRSDEKRVFLFEDCSPNVFEVLKYAPQITKKLVIKASPLYDVEQAKRDFESFGAVCIESVSYNNECKELVVEIEFSEHKDLVFRNTIISKNGEIVRVSLNKVYKNAIFTDFSNNYTYLYIGDVTFYKSRTFETYIVNNFPNLEITSKDGVALSEDFHDNFLGRKYKISHFMSFKPKEIKRYLKQNDIKSATIVKRGGKYSVTEIYKLLNLKGGSDVTLLETNNNVFFLTPIN
ncbi:MAG: RsmD family RNA methyltransferase [Rikenellaceae bacterium]